MLSPSRIRQYEIGNKRQQSIVGATMLQTSTRMQQYKTTHGSVSIRVRWIVSTVYLLRDNCSYADMATAMTAADMAYWIDTCTADTTTAGTAMDMTAVTLVYGYDR